MDHKFGPKFESQNWVHYYAGDKVGSHGWAHRLGPKVRSQGLKVGPKVETHSWVPELGPKVGSHALVPRLGLKVCSSVWFPKVGSKRWVQSC